MERISQFLLAKWNTFKEWLSVLDLIYYNIRDFYRGIRCWFRCSFSKEHLKYAYEAFTSYPFDYSYIYRAHRAQLKAQLHYYRKSHIFTEENRQSIIKWMTYAIKMIDIILDDDPKRSLFHFNDTQKRNDDGTLLPYCERIEYVCDVNVNTRNYRRFTKGLHEDYIKYIVEKCPHELYLLKAKYLYFKILFHHIENWWD